MMMSCTREGAKEKDLGDHEDPREKVILPGEFSYKPPKQFDYL